MSLVLHDFELDEGCYAVRLLLAMLGLAHRSVAVDVYPGRAHLSAAGLRLSPSGALPVLVDEDRVLIGLRDGLCHLARHHDPAQLWWPVEAKAAAMVATWLDFAVTDLAAAAVARRHAMFEAEADGPAVEMAARRAFRAMDDHMTLRELEGGAWFVGPGATIADLALFPPIALSRDCGIDHDEYPALRRWMRRLRTRPGFVTMPGIPAHH